MSSSRLPSRIATLMIVAVLLFLGAFFASVSVIRGGMDRAAAEASVDLVAQEIADLRASLTILLTDYNAWTDAWREISAQNWPWVYENYAVTATRGELLDGVVLFGGPLAEPVSWVAGQGPQPQGSYLDPGELNMIAAALAYALPGDGVTFSALLPRDDHLLMVTAMHVQPSLPELIAGREMAELPIAVFTRRLGAPLLAAIAEELPLTNLRLVARPPATGSYLALDVQQRQAQAGLAWDPSRPGTALIAMLRPMLALVAGAFAMLAVGAALLARAAAQELVRQEDRAARQARTDSLTDLPNRLAFTERMHGYDRQRPEGMLALVFLDLNGFKRINDSIGHEAGDAVVREFARRLRAAAGPTGFVARIGGDEFVVLVEVGPQVARETFRARMRALTRGIENRLAEPVVIPATTLNISAAQGLAFWESDDMTAAELIRRADLAMYRAKAARQADVVTYSLQMDETARDDQRIERALRRALEKPDDFAICYQPIVAASGRGLVRAEALARWTSGELGPVPPDRFIAVAEQTGLIGALGRLLIDRIASELATVPGLSVSLNISPVQLQSPGFGAALKAAFDRHGIILSRVEVELTEGVLVADPDLAAFHLDALHDLGFSIALDDFGTGFSSIGYLRRMPFDTLKIDRSFLGGSGRDAPNTALIQSVILLGHSIGKSVVFEGVETEPQALLLQSLGCDLLQGYRFGRPMPMASLMALYPDLRADQRRIG